MIVIDSGQIENEDFPLRFFQKVGASLLSPEIENSNYRIHLTLKMEIYDL